jgi:hypothetical protein
VVDTCCMVLPRCSRAGKELYLHTRTSSYGTGTFGGSITNNAVRRTDQSSRRVLPTVMCYCVCYRDLKNEAALGRVGLLHQRNHLYTITNKDPSGARFSTLL